MLCRHCQIRDGNRRRGLCCRCYYTPGVRQLYPQRGPFGVKGIDWHGRQRPLPRPTTAMPGSAEKLDVLAKRAQNCEELHHEADPCDQHGLVAGEIALLQAVGILPPAIAPAA